MSTDSAAGAGRATAETDWRPEDGAANWLGGPEGIRNTVRRELVARQLEEQITARFPVGQRLRVLDVGLGHGTQALRLARAGHRITGLESHAPLIKAVRTALAAEPEGIRERFKLIEGDSRETGVHFLPGSFDVVLCHGVLMYTEQPDPLLAGLARVLAPGGLLSLLVRNADALAMRPGLAGDWETALSSFDSTTYATRAGRTARADRLDAVSATLSGIGAPLHAWYGVRVLTDQVADNAHPGSVRELELMLAAEDRAGRTDPYRSVAALLHVCGVRGAPGEAVADA